MNLEIVKNAQTVTKSTERPSFTCKVQGLDRVAYECPGFDKKGSDHLGPS